MEKSQKLKSKNQKCTIRWCGYPEVKSYFRYFLLFTFTFAFCFLTFNFAFAAEYKVYSSEAIGAGEKVYSIQSCKKARSYGILYCSDDDKIKEIGGNQCEKDGKIQNVPIKGCETDEFVDAGKIYRKYDPAKYHLKEAQGGCADKPEKQGFYYAPMWGIVIVGELDQPGGPTIKAEPFVYPKDDPTQIPEAFISKISDHPEAIPKEIYQSTLCGKWDVVDKTSAVETQSEVEQNVDCAGDKAKENPLTCFVKAQTTRFTKEFVAANCNTDNSSQDIGEFPRSGPTDSGNTYTCTIYERITGASGSDILGKYISALYRWAAGIVGIVAVLTMTYSGIQISMAGGDTAKIDSAKNRIMQSIIGLAILFLSGLILYTINPGFFTG